MLWFWFASFCYLYEFECYIIAHALKSFCGYVKYVSDYNDQRAMYLVLAFFQSQVWALAKSNSAYIW